MAQVILIEPNQTLHDLISINLKTFVGVEVIPRSSANEAIDLISILPNVGLIICPTELENEDTSIELAKFINENDLETDLIIFGDYPSDYAGIEEMAIAIPDRKNWEEIIKATAKVLGITEDIMAKKINPDYIPVPVKYFKSLETSCCDVFIRIKKGPSDYQFVKRIHSGDKFSQSIISKYTEQGLKEFYIPKEFQDNFTNFVSNHLVSRLDDTSASVDEKIEALSHSYDFALNEIKELGFTPATIQLTESIVNSMIKTVESSPEMSGLLHKVINSKSSYLYQHGHMSSVVAGECLKTLGLDNKEDLEKLAYAAFFKDISLIDHEELAKIGSYEELESKGLSEEDWDLAFNHALEAAILIRKHPEAPIGVDTVIKEHHGTQNGKGYATGVKTDLSDLSKVFVISCEFVKSLMEFKEKGGAPRPIVDDLYKKYSSPDMMVIIKGLEKTLKKK